MKNILMIATGGTIASKEGDLGLTPAVTVADDPRCDHGKL